MNSLTGLEKDMHDALYKSGNAATGKHAKAVAEVAKRWIEKAFDAGRAFQADKPKNSPNKEQWLKSNSITE